MERKYDTADRKRCFHIIESLNKKAKIVEQNKYLEIVQEKCFRNNRRFKFPCWKSIPHTRWEWPRMVNMRYILAKSFDFKDKDILCQKIWCRKIKSLKRGNNGFASDLANLSTRRQLTPSNRLKEEKWGLQILYLFSLTFKYKDYQKKF